MLTLAEGSSRSRVTRIGLCILVICTGLAWRRLGVGFGWSPGLVKYGGSVLWGTMVMLLVAIVVPRQPLRNIVVIAALIAVAVEFFRLVHTPSLDAFRLTLPGALLLGRVFSPWNIVAYLGGIGLGVVIDLLVAAVRPFCARA